MAKKNIIVIGASMGGLDGITEITRNLPANLAASIFIVWHMGPDAEGVLPQVLNKQAGLAASFAKNHEQVQQGHIYIAPPDRHLMLEDGHARISHGAKENRFRPAIDPLFRSAALAYGNRVVGVILSGGLDDGVAGLWMIKACGGTAIVQNPLEAEAPSMPQNALKSVAVDYCLPVSEIAPRLAQLASEEATAENTTTLQQRRQLKREVGITMQELPLDENILGFGKISPFTCPECHGALTELSEGGRLRYRCHTGHAYSAESLLSAISSHTEQTIWGAIRGAEENIMLLNHVGDHLADSNEPSLAAAYFNKATEIQARVKYLQDALANGKPVAAAALIAPIP